MADELAPDADLLAGSGDGEPVAVQGARPNRGRPWSAEDRRLLLITVSGTVAANFITLLFVGLALGLVRGRNSAVHDRGSLAFLAALTVVGGAGLPYGIRRLRRIGVTLETAIVFIVSGVCGLFALLIWVSLAAGIK